MKPTALLPLFGAALLVAAMLAPETAEASGPGLFGRFSHCECRGDYRPPQGVVRWGTRRIRTEWEHREHCLPCGRRYPYKVKVITYRDRYSDGSVRTWKCVVSRTETPLEPYGKSPVLPWRK